MASEFFSSLLEELRGIYAEAVALDAVGEFGEPMGPARLRYVPTFRQNPDFLQEVAADLLRVGHSWRMALADAARAPTRDESKEELQAQVEALKHCLDKASKELLSTGLVLFDPDHAA